MSGNFEHLTRVRNDERGITGLETAIILIAFVVVSSVFAYTVLTAGIYSSQKSNEAINAAIEEVRSSIVPKGNIIGFEGSVDIDGDTATADTEQAVAKIALNLGVALSGAAIDLTPPYVVAADGSVQASGLTNTLVIDYLDLTHVVNNVAWTVQFSGTNDGDYSLEPTERAEVTVWLVEYNYDPLAGLYYTLGGGDSDPFADDKDSLLTNSERFVLEISPVQGAPLSIERAVPQALSPVMNLH